MVCTAASRTTLNIINSVDKSQLQVLTIRAIDSDDQTDFDNLMVKPKAKLKIIT